jgi:hypothetical protein
MRLVFLLFISLPVLPCTCVEGVGSNAKTAMYDASLVFRGAVLARMNLPQRVEMRGRGRYAITFRVDEYWKGSPGRIVVLYGVDDGTDCLGDGGYKVGKNYLVYALESKSRDVILGATFWYGWTDVLPEGTPMFVPQACQPGGEISSKLKTFTVLGRGRVSKKTE